MQDLIRTHDVLEPVAFGDVRLVDSSFSIDSSDDGVQWLGGIDSFERRWSCAPIQRSHCDGREVSAGRMIRAMSLVSNKHVRFRQLLDHGWSNCAGGS